MSGTNFMPFFNDDPAFCLGFEAGCLWLMICLDYEIEPHNIHTANAAQIELMLVERGWKTYSIKRVDETWSVLTATKY